MDVKTSFNGGSEEFYMDQLEGFEVSRKEEKSFCGLKQAHK